MSTPNTNSNINNNNSSINTNNHEINCANDTSSSTEATTKVNTNGQMNINNMIHDTHTSSITESHNSNIIGDMHNHLLNGNHHLPTPSSLITPTSSAPSLSPPRFNFNHGFCSTMSPMYTPQMSITDSYR